jgi:hypothetical protein
MVSAILPYLVLRSAVSFLMRRIYREHPKAAGQPAMKPNKESAGRVAQKTGADQ